MARKTKEETEKTRQAIMAAAITVFYERGVARSSLQEIAQQAGVTRGAIYWHFKDKVDLLNTLATEVFSPNEALLDRLAQDASDDPLGLLHKTGLETIHAMLHDPTRRHVFTILSQRCEYVAEMQELNAKNVESRDRVRDRLIRIFHQAEKNGQLAAPWTPATAAAAVQGLFFGFLHLDMEYGAPARHRDGLYAAALDALFAAFAANGKAYAITERPTPKRSA